MGDTATNKKAILDLEGANCTSCSIAIEHFAKRLDGVSDVYVDRGTSTINLEYSGDQEILDKICNLVDRLGYHATVRMAE
jgi:copper chaperone CopZ